MKTNFKTIIAAAGIILALAACSKDEMKEQPSEARTIYVEATGLLSDLTPAEDAKAELKPVVRLYWKGGDVVYAYDTKQCLGTLTVSVEEGKEEFAKLTGNIEAPSSSTITLVHYTSAKVEVGEEEKYPGAPKIKDGKLEFDFSEQDYGNPPFVAYGTMSTSGDIKNQKVTFYFASSVIKIAATGVDKSKIRKVTISGVNTKCVLSLNDDRRPDVSGDTEGNIVVTVNSTYPTHSKDKCLLSNIGIVKTGATSGKRDVTIDQTNGEKYSELGKSAMSESKSINTVVTCTDRGFVVINGLKWARQNLAISESGMKSWMRGEESAVKVPGMNKADVIVGDYFQWGASERGYNNILNDCLIYTAFKNSVADGITNSYFSLKSNSDGYKYQFNTQSAQNQTVGISPFYVFIEEGGHYTAYTNESNLDSTDDIATITLGCGWRMPTATEFRAMYNATTWTWDATDKGYYVTEKVEVLAEDKSNALLFFPAAGYGNNGALLNAGLSGHYWSSSLFLSGQDISGNNACRMMFKENEQGYSVSLYGSASRCLGYSVRPVCPVE